MIQDVPNSHLNFNPHAKTISYSNKFVFLVVSIVFPHMQSESF